MSDLVLKLVCSQACNVARTFGTARSTQALSPIKRNWGLEFLGPSDDWWEPSRVFIGWRFSGELRVDCLTRATREVARRHSILCCSLRHVDGGWRFVSGIRQASELEVPDLSGTGSTEADVIERMREFIRRPYGDTDPALRVAHARLAGEEHLIGLAIHHSFCDAYSMRIISYELAALYEAFCHGPVSPLPEPALQYLDYMIAMDEWSRSTDAAAHVAFWLRYLDGAIALSPPSERLVGVTNFRVSPQCSDALNALSRKEAVPASLVWEALHHVTLHRLLQQNDVTTLSVDSGRRQKELITLVGELVTLVPLRSHLSGFLTLREFLRKMRDERSACQPYLSTPYELLADRRKDFTTGFGALNYIPRTFGTLESFGPRVPIPMKLFQDAPPPYAYVVAVVEDAAGVSVRCIGDNPRAFTIGDLAQALESVTNKAVMAPDEALGSLLA